MKKVLAKNPATNRLKKYIFLERVEKDLFLVQEIKAIDNRRARIAVTAIRKAK